MKTIDRWSILEEMKKRFIVDENIEEKRVLEFIERILPFSKVTKNGQVLIHINKSTVVEQVKLALVAITLASRLDNKISCETDIKCLSSSLGIPVQIKARLKELKDNRFALRVEKGKYKVNPLEIGSFIGEIEKKYGVKT